MREHQFDLAGTQHRRHFRKILRAVNQDQRAALPLIQGVAPDYQLVFADDGFAKYRPVGIFVGIGNCHRDDVRLNG